MNITSILKGIENIALELFIWLIFIPKTLYKIITSPKSIPDYVTGELEKEKRFENYMSPVLLYLTICVILYASLRYVSYVNQDDNFTENVKGPEGLLFLFIPLSFVLVTGIFYKQGFRKEVLIRNLYIQCYYFSIFMLALICWRIVESTSFILGFHLGQYTTFKAFIFNKTQLNRANIPFYLLTATFVWLLAVEVWLIRKELRVTKLKAFGVIICFIVLIIASTVGYNFLANTIQNTYGKGVAEQGSIYVEKDGVYGLMVYSDSYYGDESKGLMCRIDIRIDHDNDTSNSEENRKYLKSMKESLDGFHLLPSMTLIDSLKPNNRVNFMGVEGDSLYFTLRLLESIKGRNIKDIDFDIIDSSDKSVFYDSINASGSNWDVKQRNETLVLSGLLKETGDYDLLIKSSFRGLYKLRLDTRRLGLGSDNFTIASDLGGLKTNQSYQSVYDGGDRGAELKINQSYQGFFVSNFDFAPMDLNRRYFWIEGKKGDHIHVKISPLPWDKNTDISFDIRDPARKSIHVPRVWLILNYSYIIYFILFGPILFLLFRALFTKSKKNM